MKIAEEAAYTGDENFLKGDISDLFDELERLRAEVEMLRGVGCRETKEGEPESGPCGACLRCAEERGAEWALTDEHWGMGPDEPERVAKEICARDRGKR